MATFNHQEGKEHTKKKYNLVKEKPLQPKISTGSMDSTMDLVTQGKLETLKFGWLSFVPGWLQILNRPVCFLVFLCALVVAQGMVITGISSIIITSIEKRFGFSSTQAGLLGSFYDTFYGLSALGVSYFGFNRKPKFLGSGAILMALGAFIASIPHYLSGRYEAGLHRDTDFCNITRTSTMDTSSVCKDTTWYFLAIFCLGYSLMGTGATPIYTLGPAHLDESTRRGQNGIYLGIMYGFAAIGPALGYGLGNPILRTYVDIKQPDGSTLSPNDKNWVGAWWIGYLISATLLLIVSLPLLGFPPEFPGTALLRKEKSELHDTIDNEENVTHNISSLLPSIKNLLTNKPYMFITLSTTAESLAVGGFSTFMPKFMEQQFHITSSDAAFYAGLAVVPGAGGGIFLGGYLIRKLGWDCKQTIRGAAIISFFAFIAVVSVLFGCKGNEVVGATTGYFNQSEPLSIQNSCRGNCSCNDLYFKPICTKADQLTYFSSCHAGCQKENTFGDMFYNCSCFPPGITVAEKGSCQPECKLFIPFMICLLALFFSTFLNNVPILNATFRVVPEGEGSFAMGFQQVFIRFLGFIPGPILFGKLIDSTCVLWQRDECGQEARNCLEYRNENFRYYLFAIGGFVKLLSFVFLVSALKVYRLPEKSKPENGEIVMQVFPPLDNEIKEEQESAVQNVA